MRKSQPMDRVLQANYENHVPLSERYMPKRAVALRYAPEQHQAPVLIAKGTGAVADAIITKAREAGVPIQEDRSLVEVLSKIDLDQTIPKELYMVVAELLSFIYQSDQQAREELMRR